MLSIKSSLICVEVCELAPAEAASQSQHIKLGGGTRDSRKMVSVNYLARSNTAGGGPSKILPAPRGTALKTVLKRTHRNTNVMFAPQTSGSAPRKQATQGVLSGIPGALSV